MTDAVVYTVPEMHCGHCKAAVTRQLEQVEGVRSVEVDLESKRVVVVGEQLSDESLRAALEEAGYEAA